MGDFARGMVSPRFGTVKRSMRPVVTQFEFTLGVTHNAPFLALPRAARKGGKFSKGVLITTALSERRRHVRGGSFAVIHSDADCFQERVT